VTPSIFILDTLVTRSMRGGREKTPRLCKSISWDLSVLSFRLLFLAHVAMCSSSVTIDAQREEGTIRYVSSAYFTMMFSGDRSEASMSYDEGPKPEPCVDIG